MTIDVANTAGVRRLAELAEENRRRKGEALRLFRPRPVQIEYLRSTASEKIMRGGNRSGKTVTTVAEVASAVTGIPIVDWDGNELPRIYPKGPLLVWLIGYAQEHIGRLYKKFFEPGLFKIIKDLKTGELRTWKPWDPEDAEREDETLPSPPMIPPRFLKGVAPDFKGCWSWDKRAQRVFELCRLRNGTVIHAYTSGSAPAMGDAVDIVMIDEDIKYPEHVSEWQSRLSDANPVKVIVPGTNKKKTLRGRLLWSAWPHSANDALVRMSRRANDQRKRSDPDVYEKVLWASKNPFLPKEEMRKRLESWDPVTARSRDRGEFTTDSVLVFPSFARDVHDVPGSACPKVLEATLREHNYRPPWSWTHYMSIDPGHSQPAVLAAAVCPPEFGDHIVVYDEVYLQSCESDELAQAVKHKWGGIQWEAFIMDERFGRQTTVAGKTNKDFYIEAFTKCGLTSRLSGSDFIWGSDNISARNEQVRQWLRVREDGTSKFHLIGANTENMQREFVLYKKRVTHSETTDQVVAQHNHAMDALGYLAAYEPQWVKQTPGSQQMGPVFKAHLEWDKQADGDDDGTVYMGAGVHQAA